MMTRSLGCAVVFSALACSQLLLAQSVPKAADSSKRRSNAVTKRPTTAPVPESKAAVAPTSTPKNELSKEFAVLGRRAVAALARLDEHFLDIKTLGFKGNTLELSDAKDSWTLREVAAEKTVFELEAAAATPAEKYAAGFVAKALAGLQASHNMIDTKVERALTIANAEYSKNIILGLDPVFLTGSFRPVYRAREEAIDEAVTAKDKLLSEPCYLAFKEALEAGMLKDECMPPPPVDEKRLN